MEKESYLLALAPYIVLNPVRAGLVRQPGRWKWCSYRATAGDEEPPPFLEVRWILTQFDARPERARWKYRRFVSAGKGVRIWDELKGGIVLGREDFVEGLKPLLQGKIRGGDRAAGEVGPPPEPRGTFRGCAGEGRS